MGSFDVLLIYIYLFALFTTLVRLKVHTIIYRLLKLTLLSMIVLAFVEFFRNIGQPQQLLYDIIVILPIVFLLFIVHQNDVRWFLQKLKIRRLLGVDLYEQSQNQLLEGIQYLVDHKYGAIITIQRDDDLSAYVQKASPIKAPINADVISSIFIPKSPLHDGALIIVDQTMVCAGAYFPTSESQAIPKRLGSRHRAGLGISEITDAFTIIVSEETSEVSVALDGKLDIDISKESLMLYLNQYFKQ
jgi:diadenylate cyclase